MCTTATSVINKNRYLIKTRDPVSWMRYDDEIKEFNDLKYDKYRKLIIQNPDDNQDGFYGGINEKGVAIVATYVKVSKVGISYIRKPYIRLILNASTAKEAVDIIKSFNPKIGGNIFVSDKDECYGIEAVPEEYFVEKIDVSAVKTNHFLHVKANLAEPEWLSWSQDHYKRAKELIREAKSLEDLKNILRDRKNSEKGSAICTAPTEDKCYTYSAFIFDSTNIKAYYCQGNPIENEFKEYGF